MIDRSIGIAGLALTIIAWALPLIFPEVPHWILITALAVGIFLLGLSLGLILAGKRQASVLVAPVDHAALRLHIYGDNRIPDRIHHQNIFRWFYLRGKATFTSLADNQQVEAHTSTLFVSFEPEVQILTLQVRSPDIALPPYEVKEFNQRYAIIVFNGIVGPGTLDVTVRP